MKLKFHHVAFAVRDIHETYTWYQEKLGFTLLDTHEKDHWNIARMKSGDVVIELFSFKDLTKPLPDYRKNLLDDLHVIGTKHLCMEVTNLQETITMLKTKDVEIIGESDSAYFGGDWVFIKDCNGILIEMYEQ